jgi:predicted transposase/invertase (TIGR01784 family)
LAERCLYTWSTAYRSQLSSGAPFSHLKPTYSIWLMRETLTSIKSNLPHLCFEAYDRTNNVLLSEHMQIHVLQLSKWSPPSLVEPLDGESVWLYFLKEAKSMQELPTFLRTPALEQAMTVLRRFAENEEDYHRYQAREHWLMLQATLEEDARLAREALQQEQAARQAAEVQAQQEQVARQAAEVQAQQEQAARQAAEAQAQAAEARSKQDAARAERLAERLRALGIDDV